MAFNLTWTIEGETQVSRNLRIVADRVKDWSPAFELVAETLKNVFSRDVFQSQGAVIGEHWSPLSKAYALRKARLYPGKGLLEASSTMRNSFTSLFNATSAAIWNEATYFKFHQSNQPRTKMPRRVMMKLASAQREQVVRIFNTFFQKAISASA